MGKGHGRSIELNMDYKRDMTREKRSLWVEYRAHRVSVHMIHYSNGSLGGTLKSPGKNRLFALRLRHSIRKTEIFTTLPNIRVSWVGRTLKFWLRPLEMPHEVSAGDSDTTQLSTIVSRPVSNMTTNPS